MPDRTARWVLTLVCVAFVALGFFNASVGPLLPEIAASTGSSLAAAGIIFAAISLGGTLTKLVCGPIGDRFGQQQVLLAGMLIMALGLSGIMASRTLPALLACAVLTGVGSGAVDFGGNLLVATTFSRRNATPLNFLHLCFSLGSVLGPAAVSLGLRLWATGRPMVTFPILVMLTLVPVCYTLRTPRPERNPTARASGASIYRTPLVWVFAAFLGVFVGVQIGMGGWVTTYLADTIGMPVENAALATSGYWLALSLGRLIATLLGTRLKPYTILAIDVGGGCISALILLASMGNASFTVGAMLLMGLSFGSIYPTSVALLTDTFRSAPGKAASVIMGAGSLANMLLPSLQGVLLAQQGPSSTPWFAVTCCGLLAVFLITMATTSRRSQAAA